MGKQKKRRLDHNQLMHKHRHKMTKLISPRKVDNPQRAHAATSTCHKGQVANGFKQSTENASSTMAAKHSPFKKFKDDLVRKPLKRLSQAKRKDNNSSYTQRLANSIKKRTFNSLGKNANFKRKLDFPAGSNRPKKQARLDKTIEEIVSSDEDDCIVLEPVVPNVNIVDDSNDEMTTDDLPTSSGCSRHFAVDTKRGLQWSWTGWSEGNSLMYTTGRSTLLPAQSDSCIILDDTYDRLSDPNSPVIIVDDRRVVKESPAKSIDDSVIFIEDHKGELDYIPLPAGDEDSHSDDVDKDTKKRSKRRGSKSKAETTPKMDRQRMNESLFTSTERKKLADYNSNTYNPGTEALPITHKRPIIVDGSNVAFGHGCSNVFSSEGIKICVEYFQKMGHDVKVVVPQFRRNANKSSNPALLDQLHKDGKIVFTPCKNLPNQQSISYDDRFILQLAYERNAAVVSNDNYRDLIHENPAFKKIIENRVIGYSWCDNILILPKDPYGRFGPPLAEILRC